MGNVMYMRPKETDTLGAPILRTPFSDITCQIGHWDGNKDCLPFELRWIDCCEAYGKEMAKQKCKLHYQDFVECHGQLKQRFRMGDMMEQRFHLWYKGLAGQGPKKDLFYETPRYDGYAPNFLYDDVHFRAI